VNWHTVEIDLDQCPDCRDPLEIAAVRFSFFRRTAMLFVCPNCGLMRADSSTRNSLSDWPRLIEKILSTATENWVTRLQFIRLEVKLFSTRQQRQQQNTRRQIQYDSKND
jgi:predicted RNA-binding Zn-ribbon protein involved in translation (DUF1610 family)